MPLKLSYISLFPEMISHAMSHSIMSRAQEAGLVSIETTDLRQFGEGNHKTVDDSPFGGGPGMVIKPNIMGAAIESVSGFQTARKIIFEPWGVPFNQEKAQELAQEDHLIFICGHYEGIDGRVTDYYDCETISIGGFVLTGGELPALMVSDSIVRLLQGSLGNPESLQADSHSDGLLSIPTFTRPWDWNGLTPPEILRSGHHAAIEKWHRIEKLKATKNLRPDIFSRLNLPKSDLDLL